MSGGLNKYGLGRSMANELADLSIYTNKYIESLQRKRLDEELSELNKRMYASDLWWHGPMQSHVDPELDVELTEME